MRDANASLLVATPPAEHVGMVQIDSPPRNAFGRVGCLAFIAAFEEFEGDLSIAEAMAPQREQFVRMIGTRDHGEALRAFIE